MIHAVVNTIYVIAWDCQDFNGIWTRDFAITVRCFNQLSNEATDVFAREHNEHIIDQLPTSVAS